MLFLLKIVIANVILGALISTCVRPPASDECREFFSRPLDQHEKHIVTYDLEKQLRIYKCGLARHPPEISLGTHIAESRKNEIPLLLARLEREQDEVLQYALIDIFESLSNKGYLLNDDYLLRRLRSVVSKMKSPPFRRMSENALESIQKNTQQNKTRQNENK